MSAAAATFPIPAWARTAVAPTGGALAACQPHELGAPLVARLLAHTGLPADAVDAVVLGNALGAGGNPARVLALAAGLREDCQAVTLDSQCCAGLDAVTHGCALLALGQAQVVIAGGAEAWSRAPQRLHRPLDGGAPVPYEQPAFTPWPARDPDMLQSACDWACRNGITRAAQDAYALRSHQRSLAARAAMAGEIVPVRALAHDAYVRAGMTAQRAARLPAMRAGQAPAGADCSLGLLGVSPRADGAALVLLASDAACARWRLPVRARWCGSVSLGCAPDWPMQGAAAAARAAAARSGWALAGLDALELHDAFAAQGLLFCAELGLDAGQINRQGGGLARGHPIGASGAVALVRLLAQLHAQAQARRRPQRGLACIAGAGGLGTATWVQAR